MLPAWREKLDARGSGVYDCEVEKKQKFPLLTHASGL